jgi:phosphoenolpyruvate-protein phosphotransferase/dihydroxyacetone kinase phosphotransfer subunit
VIGLVLVSHSARLAEGVAELAAQMGGPELAIAVAGGLDLPGKPLGTDAALVAQAIERVWSRDGVLVLMDLGSAVLSAELALDLLPDECRHGVLLCDAPLVEGAVAAAVAAALGGSLETVAAEARGGLAPKAAQLETPEVVAAALDEPAPAEAAPEPAAPAETAPATLRVVVANRLGLHARPAARLVRTAAAFDAEVTVEDLTAARGPVSARSLNAVAALGVGRGHELLVRARGPQADEAVAAIGRLADDDFGDAPGKTRGGADGPAPAGDTTSATAPSPAGETASATAPPPEGVRSSEPAQVPAAPAPAPAPGAVLRGLPGSPGIVVGRARRTQAVAAPGPDRPAADPRAEWAALRRALDATAADLRRARGAVAGRAGSYDAAIFDAHLLFLSDEALLGPARAAIFDDGRNAAAAWTAATAAAAAAWQAVADPYLRSRVADLRGVADGVLRHLVESPAAAPDGAPDGGASYDPAVAPGAAAPASDAAPALDAGIVITPDLAPAAVALLDRSAVLGVACAFGGPTSHGAILARSLGIPAAVACGAELLSVTEGTLLVLDGEAGTVTVAPTTATVRQAETRRAHRAAVETEAHARALEPAVTRDGLVVEVEANVAGPGEIAAALADGADGVGILRTEFLFLASDRLPDEDEQAAVYRTMAEELGGRPLVVRTLDVGADKQLPYLPLVHEENPYLGVRGIRLGLQHPELLSGQLRAVLRASAAHPVRLLLPMVTTLDELLRVRELLDEARASLDAAGAALPQRLEVGIMVEVPAAALMAESFVPHVDFFSVGTNDLTQYVLAADRGNAEVAGLGDALHPAVLRLIGAVARAAGDAGRPVAVCGEIAGDPLAVPILLGLGVTELSMTSPRIALAKQVVRAVELGAARRLAAQALAADSTAQVRALAKAATAAVD